eukprot:Sdes_comp20388_c0_seq2m14302
MTSNHVDDDASVPDIEDEAVMKDILAEAPVEETSLANILVVDNIPKVPEDKEAKLVTLLKKIFSQMGVVRNESIFLPKDAKNITKGYCFIEFASAEQANNAAKKANGYKLDKVHVFECYKLTDFERLEHVPDNFEELPPEKYQPRENYLEWLQDEKCRDQFVVRHNFSTSISYFAKNEPEQVHQRDNWTETYASWSPQGSFLATFHKQGIALWGGSSWSKVGRYGHPGAKLIDISPQENYLITWSPEPIQDGDAQVNAIIWDIKTEQKLRSFSSQGNANWPAFRWSCNDKYFARKQPDADAIQVFETPSMKILDKKSIKVQGLKDFQWSPTDAFLSFWVPESGDNPARVTIMEIPSRVEIRVKNLFNVNDCKMFWQNDGDFLAVKVDRHTKTKKSIFTNFELFRIREKQVPVDVIELKDTVTGFAWEPHGSRFGIIHTENSKISVSFYLMELPKNGGKVKLLRTLEKKQVNKLYWSPKGRFIVLAGLRSMNGLLEFWDVDEMVCMNNAEHFMATDLEWDPTGRYLATLVSYWHIQLENGYNVWSLQGKLLHKKPLEKFYSLSWRPRPPTLLSEEDIRQIKKKLKTYSTKFDRIDMLSESKVSADILQKRAQLIDEFEILRKSLNQLREEEQDERIQLLGYEYDANNDFVEKEETVEILLNEKVEILV